MHNYRHRLTSLFLKRHIKPRRNFFKLKIHFELKRKLQNAPNINLSNHPRNNLRKKSSQPTKTKTMMKKKSSKSLDPKQTPKKSNTNTTKTTNKSVQQNTMCEIKSCLRRGNNGVQTMCFALCYFSVFIQLPAA